MSTGETPRSREFQEQQKGKINTSSEMEIKVHQINVLNDSFEQFQNCTPSDYLKQLKVHLIESNEKLNESSPKEWINLVINDLLKPQTNLFTHSEHNAYFPSSKSSTSPESLKLFKFSGLIFALSIIYDASPQISFASFFLKQILHIPITQEDIKDYDPNIYDSFDYFKKHGFDKTELYFDTIINTSEGQKNVELIPNGENTKVTDENKDQYFNLMTDLLLSKSIKEQTNAFCEGFYSLVPLQEIQSITEEELKHLIYGSSRIDIEILKKRITIKPPYTAETPVIKYFFNAISHWNNQDLQKLLMFVTGYTNITKDEEIFSINQAGRSGMLPMAHTAIRSLELPEYESEEELNKNLMTCINYTGLLIE
ncbi:hypothetical protein M9Y10_003021 [Tritrichomonas musculus]|uniref:HECT-type E3 ubiquitin transferase n=1 Tax=Tritrichomonas musculus TaxID=1915356 RepID=A0ABR2JNJ6_9EUKA